MSSGVDIQQLYQGYHGDFKAHAQKILGSDCYLSGLEPSMWSAMYQFILSKPFNGNVYYVQGNITSYQVAAQTTLEQCFNLLKQTVENAALSLAEHLKAAGWIPGQPDEFFTPTKQDTLYGIPAILNPTLGTYGGLTRSPEAFQRTKPADPMDDVLVVGGHRDGD